MKVQFQWSPAESKAMLRKASAPVTHSFDHLGTMSLVSETSDHHFVRPAAAVPLQVCCRFLGEAKCEVTAGIAPRASG